MGFTTGFTGGVTLTLGVAYLTIAAHERNRQAQALYLRSQTQLLNSLFEPIPPPPPSRAELARQSRSTLAESAKDRWNEEVENAVRWIQTTDWHEVREGLEGAVSRLLKNGPQRAKGSVEGAEQNAELRVEEALHKSRVAARHGLDEASAGIDKLSASVRERLDETGEKAQDKIATGKTIVTEAVAEAKARSDHAVGSVRTAVDEGKEKTQELASKALEEWRSGAGTVDTARGAVRSVISKGIEKGKEVIGKAQEAAGLATEKIEAVSPGDGLRPRESDVEKALRERYEQHRSFERTVEEALAERYTPAHQGDSTVLRGV